MNVSMGVGWWVDMDGLDTGTPGQLQTESHHVAVHLEKRLFELEAKRAAVGRRLQGVEEAVEQFGWQGMLIAFQLLFEELTPLADKREQDLMGMACGEGRLEVAADRDPWGFAETDGDGGGIEFLKCAGKFFCNAALAVVHGFARLGVHDRGHANRGAAGVVEQSLKARGDQFVGFELWRRGVWIADEVPVAGKTFDLGQVGRIAGEDMKRGGELVDAGGGIAVDKRQTVGGWARENKDAMNAGISHGQQAFFHLGQLYGEKAFSHRAHVGRRLGERHTDGIGNVFDFELIDVDVADQSAIG